MRDLAPRAIYSLDKGDLSMSRWNRAALALTCCALFAACSTPDTTVGTTATAASVAACRDRCDDALSKCERRCNMDDTICPEACVDAIGECKSRCG
jgi:hypothetical protein